MKVGSKVSTAEGAVGIFVGYWMPNGSCRQLGGPDARLPAPYKVLTSINGKLVAMAADKITPVPKKPKKLKELKKPKKLKKFFLLTLIIGITLSCSNDVATITSPGKGLSVCYEYTSDSTFVIVPMPDSGCGYQYEEHK